MAVIFCAVVLSLAYPVREYIAERRQIDELEVQRAQISKQLSRLEAERQRLRDPAYIEQLARDRLHMCLPNQMCYVVIPAVRSKVSAPPKHAAEPWYAKLWSSVQLADGQSSPRPHLARRRPPARHEAAGGSRGSSPGASTVARPAARRLAASG